MCTVTFLSSDNQSFVLTSNRDELGSRPHAFLPNFIKINDLEIICPIDAKAKGTWIATAPHRTVCLLNGAYFPHIPQPQYRQSRGQVVLDSFLFDSSDTFLENYDLTDIEPFTLVMVNHHPLSLTELIWDGKEKKVSKKDTATPAIWSSVTLYSPEVVTQRKSWFEDFLRRTDTNPSENIIDFHRFGGDGNKENDVLMNRDGKFLTVSITSIAVDSQSQKMRYFDLVNQQEKILSFGN